MMSRELLKRLERAEAALEPERKGDAMAVLFLAQSEALDAFDREARKLYGFGRYIIVRFIESDRAIADMPAGALAFEAGTGRVLR